MIPEVSAKLSQAYLVGFFLPCSLFATATWFVSRLHLPFNATQASDWSVSIGLKASFAFLGVLAFSVILRLLNTLIIKF